MNKMFTNPFLATMCSLLLLSACGGGSNDGPSAPSFDVVPYGRSTTTIDGIRVFDEPGAADTLPSIAEIETSRNFGELRVTGEYGYSGTVNVEFADDGSTMVRYQTVEGERSVEMDIGSWRELDISTGGLQDDVVQVSGNVPPDVVIRVHTRAGNDRFEQSGDIHGSSDLLFFAGFGEDFIEMNGEALAGPGTVGLFGGVDDDVLRFGEGEVVVHGGKGDDVIVSTATRLARSIVRGGDGDDRISGLIGSIRGENGRDTFVGVDPDRVRDLEAGEEVNGDVDLPEDDTPSADEPVPESGPEPADEDPAPVSAPTQDPMPTPTASEPEPVASSDNAQVLGNLQDDIKAIWYVGDLGDIESLVNGLSSAFFSVVELEDGSATTDGTFLSEFGELAARREHPERWGESRVQGGVFGFKLDGERSWREPEFAVRTEFRRRGTTLNGCFGASSGSIAGPGASISFRSLCTDADGRFAFGGATSTSGGGGSGTVSSNARGSYLIDERAIRFDFDNGERQERLFGVYFENGFVESIIVGSSVLDAEG